jgi:RNA polymerase sigma-70 factor (ECF subfamily)
MQQPPNEQALIAQAQSGDEEAVSLLYERHVDAIFEYFRYRVDSKTTAEDLTSEVFLRMVRGLGSYRDKGLPFRAWLYRIAGNLVIDYYRQHKKRDTMALPESYESDDTDPFDRLAIDEEQVRLRLAIRTLPEDYQDLLVMRFVQELPHTEIAKIMNKSAAALRAMQHRAIKALGEQMEAMSRNPTFGQGDDQ